MKSQPCINECAVPVNAAINNRQDDFISGINPGDYWFRQGVVAGPLRLFAGRWYEVLQRLLRVQKSAAAGWQRQCQVRSCSEPVWPGCKAGFAPGQRIRR